MSTLGSLMLALSDPGIQPYNAQELTANRIQAGNTQNQTQLLELAALKRQQAAEAELMRAAQTDPRVQAMLFGGSTLGSLGQAGGPPGGAPMTQQAFAPGQPPGAPQLVPGGQDLSQFATQGGPGAQNPRGFAPEGSTPQQSILASLGPAGQPQGQMQAQRNPVLEMASTNPRAAMMLQQQLEGRQDLALQRQEQQLKMGTAVLGYVGQQAQGVTDQASLETLRQDLVSKGLQPYAAQLPQFYGKEAMAPFIARALDVKESLTLQVQDLTAQAAVIKARKEGRSVDVDNQLRALGVQPGQETPAQIKEALRLVQEGKKEVSASHGTGQIVMTPAGAIRVGKDNQVEVIKGPDGQPIYDKPTAAAEAAASYGDRAKRAHESAVALEDKGITPSLWAKVGNALPLGLGDYLVGPDQRDYQRAVNQFGGALLRKESGAVISATEYQMIDRTFFPQPNDTKKQIEEKRREREAIIKSLQEEGKGTGRTGTQAQGSGSTGSKPVSQMSAEETRAEIAAIKARGGR